MSSPFKKAQETLRREIDSYARGNVPSALALLQAPRVDNWVAEVKPRRTEFVLVITGDVTKHPDNDDGDTIQTSAVLWFDRKRRFVRSLTKIYALGKPGITGGVRS
jgi:hypothetical protein